MKRIFLSLMVMVSVLEMMAQQQYFVFIQEPNGQPFYVRIKEESHSSSANGHIILPQLKDSVYNFFIGFPRGRSGEQLFVVSVNRKDHGYELRNAGGRYSLYDLQTQQTISPASTEAASDQTIRKNDSYSRLMSDVVDDSAVLYTSAQDTMSVDSNAVPQKMAPVVTVPVAPQSLPSSAQQQNLPATPAVAQQKPADTAQKETETEKKSTSTAQKPNETDQKPAAADVAQQKPAATEKKPAQNSSATANDDSTKNQKTQNASAAVQPNLPANDSSTVKTPSSTRDSRDIIRLSTENIQEGKLMIYVDRSGPTNDTIRLVIPRKL